ncbi:MAG: hypothetical protein GXO81_09470 [Chlorobi bacterium]|uniref:Uncharacterized protein n=1 Tax=hydrothermal vent metagenome TaxID=652676 RepID=A0A3B0TQQ9_9ZZZZ|nr:hypothetical protein [Chlorobiota bacterium]
MATTDQIRNNLIDKILSIGNKDILSALDRLLETTIREKDVYKVSKQQRLILQASMIDIENDGLISDEDLNKEEDLWLNK